MTDTTLNRFVASGTTAERGAFTPDPPTPASGPDPGYLWWDTDLQEEFAYDFGLADWVSTGGGAGSGNVTGPGASSVGNITVWADTGGEEIGDSGVAFSTDGTLTADSDGLVPTQKAVKTYVDTNAGVGALTLITETTTTSSAGNVTFSSIPATYRDLEIRIRGRGTNAGQDIEMRVQFNGDTGNNYSSFRIIQFSGITDTLTVTAGPSMGLGRLAAAGASNSTEVGFLRIDVGDYRGTTFFKQVNATGTYRRSTGDPGIFMCTAGGEWSSASAVNAVKIFPVTDNFTDGTIVSLYGRM